MIKNKLQEESMRRLRWRLWFAFSESKYEQFHTTDSRGNVLPNFKEITKYCIKHWQIEIKDMTERELSERIAIVRKWK
jgi:hypothetical protein